MELMFELMVRYNGMADRVLERDSSSPLLSADRRLAREYSCCQSKLRVALQAHGIEIVMMVWTSCGVGADSAILPSFETVFSRYCKRHERDALT